MRDILAAVICAVVPSALMAATETNVVHVSSVGGVVTSYVVQPANTTWSFSYVDTPNWISGFAAEGVVIGPTTTSVFKTDADRALTLRANFEKNTGSERTWCYPITSEGETVSIVRFVQCAAEGGVHPFVETTIVNIPESGGTIGTLIVVPPNVVWRFQFGNRPEWISSFSVNNFAITQSSSSSVSGSAPCVVRLSAKVSQAALLSREWHYEITCDDKPVFVVRYKQGGTDKRRLRLFPIGPSAGSGSADSRRYRSASGLGAGLVSSERGVVSDWFETDVLGLSDKAWHVTARGYKVGEVDGNVSIGGANYAYTDSSRDSFFYGWLSVWRENNKRQDVVIQPECQVLGPSAISLCPSPDDLVTVAEAVFSKEWLSSDNMGDINQDSIPDIYVVKYGLGVVDPLSGEVIGNDCEYLRDYNDDNDYLPIDSNSNPYSSLLPGLSGLGPLTPRLFSAELEIRGFGEALNDAPFQLGIEGVAPSRIYTDPEIDANSTLTKLEYFAWSDYTNANPTATVADWSPERPTDPTKADTDGDGIDDGTEYWWWYRAHVGYFDSNGVHKYATGRRYDPRNPGFGRRISRETIESIMDPLMGSSLDHGADTDEDGLPDLIELELGTNPFDFDTDGDGLPDGYEIMFSATDPLNVCTDSGVCDPMRNFDGDAMAFSTPESEHFELPQPSNICQWTTFAVLSPNGDSDGVQWYAARTLPSLDYQMRLEKMKVFETPSGRVCTTAPVRVSEDGRIQAEISQTSDGLPVAFALADVEPLQGRVPALLGSSSSYLRLEPVSVEAGVQLQMQESGSYVVETDVTVLSLASSVTGCNSAWIYGCSQQHGIGENAFGMLAAGRYLDVPEGAVITALPDTSRQVALLHYLVYQEFGFDPRTAWNPNSPLAARWGPDDNEGFIANWPTRSFMGVSTRTRPFTVYDEFLLFSFFLNNGVLQESDARPGLDNGWDRIWGRYTTASFGPNEGIGLSSGDGSDTDGDGVPDGWELYVMGGPKDETADNFIFAGPYDDVKTSFGPFVAAAAGVYTDVDGDGLTERLEYDGIDSCAYYREPGEDGRSPYSVTIGRDGSSVSSRKYFPTDPWHPDANEGGVMDGGYFLECDGKWWDVEVERGEVTICGCYESDRITRASGAIRVPVKIGFRPVTRIAASAFSYNYGLTSVEIPAGVRSIEEGAFAYCLVGLSVDPENESYYVEQGALYSFGGETLLYWPPDHEIVVRAGLSRIGAEAFAGNFASIGVTVDIPASVVCVGSGAFCWVGNKSGAGIKAVNFREGLVTVEDSAFAWAGLESCSLPASIQNIGAEAFGYCENLSSVTFEGDRPTNVAENAFCKLLGLYEVDEELCFYAYDDTSGWPTNGWWLGQPLVLIHRVIPGSECTISFQTERAGPVAPIVRKYGDAYGDLPVLNFEGLTFLGWCRERVGGSPVDPDEVVLSDETLFACWGATAIIDGRVWRYQLIDNVGVLGWEKSSAVSEFVGGEVIVPATLGGYPVRAIGAGAFSGCGDVETIVLPQNLVEVGEGAFSGCSNLVSVVLPEGVTAIPPRTFEGCAALEELVIPAGVQTIGEEAFAGCASLKAVEIPEGVTKIAARTFAGCEKLSSVKLPESLERIDAEAFVGCAALGSVTIPANVSEIGENAFGECKGLGSVRFYGQPPTGIWTSGLVNEKVTIHGPADVTVSPADRTVFGTDLAVTLATSWAGGVVRYTLDGSVPTAESPAFDGITVHNKTTVRAATFVEGLRWSEIEEATYGVGKVATPTAMSTQGGTFYHNGNVITLDCATSGVEIRYTFGGEPTANSTLYTGPFEISRTTTVKAKAFGHPDYVDSDVMTAEFVRAWEGLATPVISPDGGLIEAECELVTITCETEDVTIYYTLDGSRPSATNGRVYTEPFKLYQSGKVNAIAAKFDWADSEVASMTFTRGDQLGEALNYFGAKVTNDANAPWTVDAAESHDGVSAVRSTAVEGGMSGIKLTVKGAGRLSFWWKASCEEVWDGEYYDYGSFKVGSEEKAKIAGQTDWQRVVVDFETTGKHTLHWDYAKDDDNDEGKDCIWVDQVVWIPADGSGVTLTTGVPVPYAWLEGYGLGVTTDFETVANARTGKRSAFGKELTVWEDYVTGTNPTNLDSVFRTFIDMSSGVPKITWEPDLNKDALEPIRAYRVFGAKSLDGQWFEVDGDEGEYNFFKVAVELFKNKEE